MESEYDNVEYCQENDTEYVYCQICDNYCIRLYYNNHLKSNSHTNNFYKKQRTNI